MLWFEPYRENGIGETHHSGNSAQSGNAANLKRQCRQFKAAMPPI
jgi:hypothetical protein